jgi:hypothetical protein
VAVSHLRPGRQLPGHLHVRLATALTIEAFGEVLAGTGKPFVIASGILVVLALESAPVGSVLHAVGDEGVPIRETRAGRAWRSARGPLRSAPTALNVGVGRRPLPTPLPRRVEFVISSPHSTGECCCSGSSLRSVDCVDRLWCVPSGA